MTRIKRWMHTPSNMAAFFVSLALCPIFGVGVWFFSDMTVLRIVMTVVAALLALYLCFLFLVLYRIFDRVVFTDDGVEHHSVFGKKTLYGYGYFYAYIGEYTSSVERKICVTLTPKSGGRVVTEVSTSKYGNVVAVNRLGALYCPVDEPLRRYLLSRKDLEWIGEEKSSRRY